MSKYCYQVTIPIVSSFFSFFVCAQEDIYYVRVVPSVASVLLYLNLKFPVLIFVCTALQYVQVDVQLIAFTVSMAIA